MGMDFAVPRDRAKIVHPFPLRVLFGWIICVSFAGATHQALQQSAANRIDGLCESLVIPRGGYYCQEYVARTHDGFLLGVQRMSSTRANPAGQGRTVFLMHGLLVGGDVWVLNSPSQALGFIMADAGYDVWIGNTRTTKFSHGHAFYDRTDQRFWDWSVDEMADHDLPAMLGLVFRTTGRKMHYIGYSQGSQQAFAAFSQGHLLSYIDKMVMLAPVAYVDHGTAPLELGLFNLHTDQILEDAHVYEFSTETPMGNQVVDLICGPTNARCFQDWIYLFAGENCCLNLTKRTLVDRYETQATSVKNLAHLAQQGHTSSFARFDYGTSNNIRRYGSAIPPMYDMSYIPTHNLLLINGVQDALADPIDVDRLISELHGHFNIFTSPTFGHLDFILADNATDHIYTRILSFLVDS